MLRSFPPPRPAKKRSTLRPPERVRLMLSQANRLGKLTTPLGKDVLCLVGFEADEGLSRLFVFDVLAVSADANIDLDQLLGRPAHIELDCHGLGKRYYHGLILEAEFDHLEEGGNLSYYRLLLRPWTWLLGKTSDCRIHHDKTVVDIITDTLSRRGFSHYRFTTIENYPKLHYTVQYRETDLNFISRLMEQHGIYYFFEHSAGSHELVFADSANAHKPAPGQASVAFNTNRITDFESPRATIYSWRPQRKLRSGRFELNDYNHMTPNAHMRGNRDADERYDKSQLEIYVHPGMHGQLDEGERYARVRLEAEQAVDKRRVARGNAVAVFAGAKMELERHPRGEENDTWIAARIASRFGPQSYYAGGVRGAVKERNFEGEYEFQRLSQPFRAPLETPKPLINSLQTAKVVGAKGEEIDCDDHGRVLVHFFWDRHGDKSCRLRVSQVWGGSNWGAQVIPRIGMEVMVAFIDGDPDRPIVVGCVPNPQTLPVPYELPANKTRMVWRSNSHKSRGRSEMTIEDATSRENFFLHAQKDWTHRVLNNHTQRVDSNHVASVGANHAIDVGGNYKTEVGGAMNLVVGGTAAQAAALITPQLKGLSGTTAELLTEAGGGQISPNVSGAALGFFSADGLKGLRGVTDGNADPTKDAGNALRSAGAQVGQDAGSIPYGVSGTMNTIVGAFKTDTVGCAKSETVGVAKVTNVGKNFYTQVGDTNATTVGKTWRLNVGEAARSMIGKTNVIDVGETFEITAGQKFS